MLLESLPGTMASYTEAEKEQLIKVFEGLPVKPKLDTTESLQNWMEDYLESKGRGRLQNRDQPKPELIEPEVIQKTVLQKPRIVTFSGSRDAKDVSFETWMYEVSTYLREGTYSKKEVETALKKSLRGSASDVVRRMGVNAELDAILHKLGCIYGVVEQADSLLTQFYGAQQRQSENVADWACRLEDLLDRANQQDPIHGRSMDEMLRNRFWHGLRRELRDAARGKAERITDFDLLIVQVRRIEAEDVVQQQPTDTKRGQVKAITDQQLGESEECSLKVLLAKMDDRLDNLEKSMKSVTTSKISQENPDSQASNSKSPQSNQDRGRGRGRGRGGFRGRGRGGSGGHNHADSSNNYSPPDNNNSWYNYSSWQGGNNDHNTSSSTGQGQSQPTPGREVTCYRCGQIGHVAYGCRVVLDHLNQ